MIKAVASVVSVLIVAGFSFLAIRAIVCHLRPRWALPREVQQLLLTAERTMTDLLIARDPIDPTVLSAADLKAVHQWRTEYRAWRDQDTKEKK